VQIVNTNYAAINQTQASVTLVSYGVVNQCSCDILAGTCDFSCCSDPDCSPAAQQAWYVGTTSTPICLKQESDGQFYKLCLSEALLPRITDSKTQQTVSIQQFDLLTCITYMNVPFMGWFYPVVSDVTESQADVIKTIYPSYRKSVTQRTLIDGQVSYGSAYLVGQFLSASVNYPDFQYVVPTVNRYYIPMPNPFGICERSYSVKFLQNVQPTDCTQVINLNNYCSQDSVLSSLVYTQYQTILQNPQSSVIITPTLRNFYATSGNTSQVPYLVSNSSGCYCLNTLQRATLIISPTTTYQVQSAVIDIYQTDLYAPTCTTQFTTTQTFSAQFISNLQGFPNSGAPGYHQGLPLLMGIQSPTAGVLGAMAIQMQGFWIRGVSNTGQCVMVGATGDYYDSRRVPLFKEQRSTSCSLSFTTQAAFQAFCTSANFQSIELFQNFNTSVNFGRFGNSNVNYPSDWVNLTDYQAFSSYSVSWNNGSLQCTIPTKEVVAVYYAYAGFSTNIQTYIVQALRTFQTTVLTYNPNKASNQFTFTEEIVYVQIPQKNESLTEAYADYFGTVFSPISGSFQGGEVLKYSFAVLSFVWFSLL
jgi:hypothetical protein